MVLHKKTSNTPRMAGPWIDTDIIKNRSDPLPPLDEYDDRPVVRDLIQKHQSSIRAIQQLLEEEDLYDPVRHDDLWILRYYLSQKSIPKAAKAAISFLQYRHEHRLDETDIRLDPPGPNCQNKAVQQFFNTLEDDGMIVSWPDPLRGTIIFMTMKGIPQKELVNVPFEAALCYMLEWQFQIIDSVTRKTGRLTKGIRILDFQNYHSSQHNYRPFMNRCSEWGKVTQDSYPQTLGKVYMVNTPTLVLTAFGVLKHLIPKRFVEKFAILNPKTERHLFYKYMSPRHLPCIYGGNFPVWPYPRHVHLTESIANHSHSNTHLPSTTLPTKNKAIATSHDKEKHPGIKQNNTESTASSSTIVGSTTSVCYDYDSYFTTTTTQEQLSYLCGDLSCCHLS